MAMARSRNLKPSFFTDDELAALPALTRLLFAGLWTVADRAGRLEDRPLRIKAEVLPYDNCDVNEMLQQLDGIGVIHRYAVGPKRYIQIRTFAKHQNPHIREPQSVIPPPQLVEVTGGNASTVLAPDEHSAEHPPGPEDSGFRIPSSGLPQPGAGTRPQRSRVAGTPDGDKSPRNPKPNGDLAKGWWHTNEGIEATGRLLGIPAKPGELHGAYKARLFDEIRRRQSNGKAVAAA